MVHVEKDLFRKKSSCPIGSYDPEPDCLSPSCTSSPSCPEAIDVDFDAHSVNHLAHRTVDESNNFPRKRDDIYDWTINITDPLMTDVTSEPERFAFTGFCLPGYNSSVLSDQIQQPYEMLFSQRCPCPSSSPSSTDSMWSSSSGLHSAAVRSRPEPSSSPFPSSTPHQNAYRRRKPKFFRSDRFSQNSDYHVGYSRPVRGVLGKRWAMKCDSPYMFSRKRPRSNVNADTSPSYSAGRAPDFADEESVPPQLPSTADYLLKKSRNRPHDYSMSPSPDHSPYVFHLSPTQKNKEFFPNSIENADTTFSASTTGSSHNPKRLHLLQFIEQLLHDQTHSAEKMQSASEQLEATEKDSTSTDCIKWVNEDARIFAIKSPVRLAQLWGLYKNNRNMTFESLCRSLRLYYVSGKLERVRGQRNQYRLLDGPLK
ncbi:unnamed protein product [Calicophoron daubneyi]|uniref:ETS domain-containing protein n=1 Tax=Calicophoron daubneyi TaxID=300641 RepID=A0AAV2TQI1_CALDB